MEQEEILELDSKHIWHPYAAPGAPVLPVRATDGVHLHLSEGTQLIDAMSSWWSAIHGHGHPRLVNAAIDQARTMSHVMFGGLTHEPAARLTRALRELIDDRLTQVFYSDSGSVAVEVAVKMALQHSRGIGHPERSRLLTWRSGYHGDTFAAMSVCDPEGGMHSLWQGALAEQLFAPAPPTRGSAPEKLEHYLEQLDSMVDESVAAIIIEPVVQGAGGMRFHDHRLVTGVREICDRHGILMIADEIATGFGRTGSLFATSAAGVTPDIMCVGKALTGGFMTLAATLCTSRVAAAISSPEGGGALMHGPTFMANPLACAVAAESLAMISEGGWRTTVPRIAGELEAGLRPLIHEPGVADVRVLGAIGVVEMDAPVDMAATTAVAVAEGVWLRPFGRLIYVMPPYISTTEHISTICQAVTAAVRAEGR